MSDVPESKEGATTTVEPKPTRDYTEKERKELDRIIKYSEGTRNPPLKKGVKIMTVEPQKEYIITEKQLHELSRLGEYSNSFFKFVPPIILAVCSRPAKESSEKVLEDLKKSISELHQFENDTGLIYLSDVLYQIELRTKECDR